MSQIRIIEKPVDMSFEVIRDILQKAHKTNFDKGIVLHTTTLSAEELKDHIGKDGKCFVAMDGDRPVGTASYRIIKRKSWYYWTYIGLYCGKNCSRKFRKNTFSFIASYCCNRFSRSGYFWCCKSC